MWPRDARKHPGMLNFPGEGGTLRYGEGVLVGQRAYDHLGIEPLFRLGHGCSYTTFVADEVAVTVDLDAVVVRCALRNSGGRDGTEVVQVRAHGLRDGGRLVGFARRDVPAGGVEVVEVVVPRELLRCWDPVAHAWTAATGTLAMQVSGVGWGRRLECVLGDPEHDGPAPTAAGMAPTDAPD